MSYSFNVYGHENITARHKKTLEFCRTDSLTLAGDCIIGVGADYELAKIKKLISIHKYIKLSIFHGDDELDSLEFQPNPYFSDHEEMVIRMSGFISDRTLGIYATKSSYDLSDKLKMLLKTRKSFKVILDGK